MPRSNQVQQSGAIINGSLTGTGTTAVMIPAQEKGYFTDIVILILTSSGNAIATLSDGKNNYVFNLIRGTISISLSMPLKANLANTAWTLNAPPNVTSIWQAIILNK